MAIVGLFAAHTLDIAEYIMKINSISPGYYKHKLEIESCSSSVLQKHHIH